MYSTYIQYEDKIRPNSAMGVALPSYIIYINIFLNIKIELLLFLNTKCTCYCQDGSPLAIPLATPWKVPRYLLITFVMIIDSILKYIPILDRYRQPTNYYCLALIQSDHCCFHHFHL